MRRFSNLWLLQKSLGWVVVAGSMYVLEGVSRARSLSRLLSTDDDIKFCPSTKETYSLWWVVCFLQAVSGLYFKLLLRGRKLVSSACSCHLSPRHKHPGKPLPSSVQYIVSPFSLPPNEASSALFTTTVSWPIFMSSASYVFQIISCGRDRLTSFLHSSSHPQGL